MVRDRDLQRVALQLGRPPRGMLSVECRCPCGYPQVIRVYPLLKYGREREVFPTHFWLTCSVLVERIAQLEESGLIRRLEGKLAQGASLRAEHARDHERYSAERWASLTGTDRRWLIAQGQADALRKRGIAGIADRRHLKCLHAHYAYHLARGSAIGRLIEAQLEPLAVNATDARSCARRYGIDCAKG